MCTLAIPALGRWTQEDLTPDACKQMAYEVDLCPPCTGVTDAHALTHISTLEYAPTCTLCTHRHTVHHLHTMHHVHTQHRDIFLAVLLLSMRDEREAT